MIAHIRPMDLYCWHCFLESRQKNFDIVVIEMGTEDTNMSFCRDHWDKCKKHSLQIEKDYEEPHIPEYTVTEMDPWKRKILKLIAWVIFTHTTD